MHQIRTRLTYANVMATIAVFLVLGGASAFAAGQLAKNSVGSKQLKKNSVTAAKIKKNAITKAKIKDGSVTGAKIADGSITGTEINAASTSFSQVVARLRTSAQGAFGSTSIYPIGSYTQPAGEDDQYLAALTVSFAASCGGERVAQALLLVDPPSNLGELTPGNIVGLGVLIDKTPGAATKTLEFAPYPGSFSPMSKIAPAAATTHTFSALLTNGECDTGSGVTVSGGAVDVIGTK